MERGDIYWIDLPDPTGSGPGFRRPGLVVQCDPLNRSRLATVIILSLTSSIEAARHPTCILLRADETGLPRDSVVNASSMSTVDKSDLQEHAGHVPDEVMALINDRMRQVLDL